MLRIGLAKKDRYIQFVNPQIILNRFDFIYGENYDLIEVIFNHNKYYLPLHIDIYSAKLGLYMTKLPDEVFDSVIKFIFKTYKKVAFIEVRQSLNSYRGLKEGKEWMINLPSNEEEYSNSLGKKTRLHVKQYFKYIERDFNVEFKTFEKDIPTDIITQYYKFKKETLGHIYSMPEQDYLKEFSVTKSHVLYLDGEVAAISFICELPEFKTAYYENFSYNKKLSKYSLGTVITYYTIKKLIDDGYKTFYMGDGEYLYKQNMSNENFVTYSGKIKRRKGYGFNTLFSFGQSDYFYYLNIFGFKIKKRIKKENCPIEINKNTRCLLVAPHPDDDMLGAGEFLIKYSNNFDCICMGSSGLAIPEDNITAKERSQMRINEFNTVMDKVGVKKHWIFETYGIPRFDSQMDSHFNEYCDVLDLEKYDYIFLPHPFDGHHEHRYITNKLFKRIIKNKPYNKNCRIVFYEVWDYIKNPNVFFDTRNGGFIYSKNGFKKYQAPNGKLWHEGNLLDTKIDIIEMYKSQWNYDSFYNVTTMKKCATSINPIQRYKVVNIEEYLKMHPFNLKYGFA